MSTGNSMSNISSSDSASNSDPDDDGESEISSSSSSKEWTWQDIMKKRSFVRFVGVCDPESLPEKNLIRPPSQVMYVINDGRSRKEKQIFDFVHKT